MNMATIVVSGVYAHARMYSTIPAGIVGATVTFEFTDPIWEGLTKTAVFQGAAVRDVILTGNTAVIPAETVAKAGPMLKVGIYGVDAENNLVIPTLWAAIGGIRDAADPSGDPGTDPELPIWAQLADRVEGVAKDVDALKQTGGGGPGTPGAPGADGGYYTPAVTQPDEDTIQFEFTPSKEGMPAIDPAQIELPAGPPGPQGSPGQPGRDGLDGKDGKDGKDGVVAVTGATVGQTVKISAVDEKGVPTAWEPTDFPSGGGGGYELVGYVQLEENVVSVDIELEKPCTNLIIAAYTNTRSAGGNSPHFVTVEADGKETSISAKYNICANDYAAKVWCPATSNTTSTAVRTIVLGYYHYEKVDGVFAGFSSETEVDPGYSRPVGFSGVRGITGDFINKLNFSCTDAKAYLAKGVQISIWGC